MKIAKQQSTLKRCADMKPRMDALSTIFESEDIDFADSNIVALESFVAELKKESNRCKDDYDKVKSLSKEMLILMEKRCGSCASIAYSDFEIDTHEDLEEMDLSQPLSIKNCISILRRSKKVGNQQLYGQAFDFLLRNFMGVVNENKTSFYRRISQSVLEDLVKSDKLIVKSVDDIVSVVIEWLNFDLSLRKKCSLRLLKHVRFGDISTEMLREIESDLDHVIMVNEESKKWLQDALAGKSEWNPRNMMVMVTKLMVFQEKGMNLLFDPVEDKWTEWQGVSHGDGFCVVNVRENVFLLGGCTEEGNLSKVSIYNKETKEWRAGPNMLEGRRFFSACVTSSNTIYVMGGINNSGMSNSAEMLQCDESGAPVGSWQRIPAMNVARAYFEAACVDDKIYAIGGCLYNETVEVFDPKMNTWSHCKSMTRGRHRHTVSTYNGEIYVFGSDGFCEKYNPSTDQWTPLAQLDNAKGHSRGSAVVNDRIYVIGGWDSSEVDIYDIKTNSWSKGPQMPKKIGCTKCIAFSSKCIIL